MNATKECTRPAIIGKDHITGIAMLFSLFSAGCGGGGGDAGNSFSLTVEAVNPGETVVDWSPHPESNVYQVLRDGQQIIRAEGDTAYTDRGLFAGTRYCYVVRALGSSEVFDASSNEVCVTMPKSGSEHIETVGAGKKLTHGTGPHSGA